MYGTDVFYQALGLPTEGWSSFEGGSIVVDPSYTGTSITIPLLVLQKQVLTGQTCQYAGVNYPCFSRSNVIVEPVTFNLAQASVVSISATQSIAVEGGAIGTFTVSLTGSTASPLTVFYQTGGTAEDGIDYETLSGSVVILAGQSSVTITVMAIADGVPDGNEAVELSLESNAAYTLGSPSSATVMITDSVCEIALDESYLEDADALLFEAFAPNAPPTSLKPPYVHQTLYDRALDWIDSVQFFGPNLHIESGWRPLKYQEHLRDIRNQWIKYMTKLTEPERIDCAEEFQKIENEIKTHGLVTCKDANKCIVDQPLVSAKSAHSGDAKGNPPAVAVDIAPKTELESIPGLLRSSYVFHGLTQPCPADRVHFGLKGSPQSCTTISGTVDPPFNILVVDPLGRRLGFDPATKSIINDIGPEASYSGWNTDLQFFDIGGALPGIYLVTPVEVGVGPYDLRILQLGEEAEILEAQNISGFASPGRVIVPIVVTVPWNLRIDIKPNDFPNIVNPRSRGRIPVAIVSSDDFDASAKVDISSLTFGRTGDEQTSGSCHPEDVNGDGLIDLLCHFETAGTGFQTVDTEGVLKGKTLDGIPIIGSDSVNIVP